MEQEVLIRIRPDLLRLMAKPRWGLNLRAFGGKDHTGSGMIQNAIRTGLHASDRNQSRYLTILRLNDFIDPGLKLGGAICTKDDALEDFHRFHPGQIKAWKNVHGGLNHPFREQCRGDDG